jgi:hypothetical protein
VQQQSSGGAAGQTRCVSSNLLVPSKLEVVGEANAVDVRVNPERGQKYCTRLLKVPKHCGRAGDADESEAEAE